MKIWNVAAFTLVSAMSIAALIAAGLAGA